jgi:hypothetical protein
MGTSLRALVVVTTLLAGLLASGTPVSATPPSNDDFDDATVITTLPFIDRLDASEATSAPDDPSCFGSEASIWYAFTPAEDVTVEATTFGSRYDTTLSAWTGTRGDLDQIACSDDAPGGVHSRVVFAASAGTTYHLMVAAFPDTASGILTISAWETGPLPANDDFDQATPIDSLPFSDSLDASAATRAADDPECAEPGASVWYSFTPGSNMLVEANTFGSDYDTTLSTWTGERGDLQRVACNDDQGEGLQSQILFVARAGVTYHLMAGTFGVSPAGQLELVVDERARDDGGFDCPTDLWLFEDVSEANVHLGSIRCGTYLEIVRGYPDGTFRPELGVRRDQMASFIARTVTAAGVSLPEAQHGFADLGGNAHEEAIGQLAAAGIVRGTTSTSYSPARVVTRDQMATYLVRTLEWSRDEQLTAPRSPYTDIAGNTHRRSIDVAHDQGLTVGRTPTTYGPRDSVRRGQSATFAMRLLGRIIAD